VSVRIGIDLGGTKIEGVALEGSREVARSRVDTPRNDYNATLEVIGRLVADLEHRIPLARRSSDSEGGDPESPIPAAPTIGIGIPGTISSSTGLVKNANSTWLIGQRFQHDLEARLKRPVRVANDANCFAMSEAIDGAAAGASIVFGVILGTGVGGGIVVNGRVVNGANGVAGEWGHNPLPWPEADDLPGTVCYCGKRGCIETFLSGPGLAADHERISGVRLQSPQIVDAAMRGDAAAEATLRRYERRIARALAAIINVLDPDVIVLGGGLSNIERLYANVPRLWSAFIFAADAEDRGSRIANPESRAATRLVPAQHGESSGVLGAARLWP
jgi:fructokinase